MLQAENDSLKADVSLLNWARDYRSSRSSQTGDSSAEDDGTLPEPVFDKSDNVFRCSVCHFEVCDGVCQNSECAQRHEYDVRTPFILVII